MLGKDDLGRLLEYTVWANHRVVRVAATLTVDEFRRDLGSSHGGVRGTLAHMLSSEHIWLERWKGLPNPPHVDEAEFSDVLALRERWAAVEHHRQTWFAELREEDAAATLRYRNQAGQPFQAPLWQLVQHVANHATHHRGQVIAFLRQLGTKPPNTDLVTWDREQAH